MDTIREVLAPDFLLRNSVYISLLLGLACPLVGIFLVLRRLIFMGVALPQISSCGIAGAYALHTWGLIPHGEDVEHSLAFFGSAIFTLGTILVLSRLELRGREGAEGRLGAVYVLAGAWAILLLVMNPYGEHGLLERLKGEIIAVSNVDLGVTASTLGCVMVVLFLFRKELLLVSFDREMAVSLGKNVLCWDGVLFFMIGLTVSMAVLSVGPLVTFGFLLLPALTAYQVARSLWQLAVIASLVGVVTALAGFCMAYRLEWPVGPTDVALLGVVYWGTCLGRKAFGNKADMRMASGLKAFR